MPRGIGSWKPHGNKGRFVASPAREKAKTLVARRFQRRMFRSLRTGEVIDKRWLRFSFPAFWHYDVLRGLDYRGMQESNPTAASVTPSKP